MKNKNEEETIEDLVNDLKNLKLKQTELDKNIRTVEKRLRSLLPSSETIGSEHIGRKCKILNPNTHQPAKGTIVGLTKGNNPFIRVKKSGFVEIRRLPKNLELLPKEK